MSDESTPEVGRRRALFAFATVASAGLAGCSSVGERGGVGNSGATDVVVSNAASGPRTVSVTVTAAGAAEPHTSRTLSLAPGGVVDPVNRSKLPTNTDQYTVEVAVEDGPEETFEWADPTVELAPLWVRVDDSRNIRFLLQAG
jgi:hypothetical protein